MTSNTPEPSPSAGYDLATMRRAYATTDEGLRESTAPAHWLPLFEAWLADAIAEGITEPNAMTVATAGADGRPSARTVLLKGVDAEGFTFYTNYMSRKGRQIATNPYASLVFGWFAIRRQVLVTGSVERVPREVTEAYFATRPRESQLGTWASAQSEVVADRASLDAAYVEAEARFSNVDAIPAPPHWGGLRVRPDTVEFWHGRIGRLHDRLRYRRPEAVGAAATDDMWVLERLAP